MNLNLVLTFKYKVVLNLFNESFVTPYRIIRLKILVSTIV